jgi:pilus assembly protein Flp/PilA
VPDTTRESAGLALHLRSGFPDRTEERQGKESDMKKLLSGLIKDESGASLIEYVLIAGLISVVGYLTMQGIGTDLGAILTNVHSATTAAKG